jgi:hypothetical protein
MQFCTNRGVKLEEDAKFCGNRGKAAFDAALEEFRKKYSVPVPRRNTGSAGA